MNEKRKNSEIPFSQTPVGAFCINLQRISIIVSLLLLLFFGLIFILVEVFFTPHNLVTEANMPLVQEAVRNQCEIPDYIADAYIDDSDFSSYYDNDGYQSFSRIVCSLDAQNQWQCTCEE